MFTYSIGTLSKNGYRKDLDKELFVYADIANENRNWYIEENLNRCLDPKLCYYLREKEDRAFRESMYSYSGAGCLRLTTSLVNVPLKNCILIVQIH